MSSAPALPSAERCPVRRLAATVMAYDAAVRRRCALERQIRALPDGDGTALGLIRALAAALAVEEDAMAALRAGAAQLVHLVLHDD